MIILRGAAIVLSMGSNTTVTSGFSGSGSVTEKEMDAFCGGLCGLDSAILATTKSLKSSLRRNESALRLINEPIQIIEKTNVSFVPNFINKILGDLPKTVLEPKILSKFDKLHLLVNLTNCIH